MNLSVIKGQKVDVTKNIPGLSKLKINIGWTASTNIDLDSSSFILTSQGKVRGDEDLIFYGNPKNSFISYIEESVSKREININLLNVEAIIDKMVFTLTIHEAEARKQNFSQVQGVYIQFSNETTGQQIFRFDLGHNFSVETAIVIGELYRYNGQWKFNAVGAGYSGGLKSLCDTYGIEVSDNSSKVAPPSSNQSAPKTAQAGAPMNPPPIVQPTITENKPPQLNLSKIELKKKGDKINLEKKAGGLGEISINLNWNQQTKKASFWGRSSGVDLDLACLYELKNGKKGVVPALGDSFGSLTREPYISLDGDDRTGSIKTGENIRINGMKLSEFRRILVFTFIYEGVNSWSEADGIVTIKQTNGPDIIVRLNECDDHRAMCAIALIENQGNETFSIERVVRYFAGHKEIDQAFNWGLRWVAGSK